MPDYELPEDDKLPMSHLITEVRREIALRANVYPKWIAAGRLRQEQATYRIAAMNQILDILLELDGGGKEAA